MENPTTTFFRFLPALVSALAPAHRIHVSICNASARVPADNHRVFAAAMRWGLSTSRNRKRARDNTNGPAATPQYRQQGECARIHRSDRRNGRPRAVVAPRSPPESDRRCRVGTPMCPRSHARERPPAHVFVVFITIRRL